MPPCLPWWPDLPFMTEVGRDRRGFLSSVRQMKALCEQCGSVSIVRASYTPADRFVAILTAKRPFRCRRCGWRGRRYWTDKDLRKLLDYGAGGAEPDPALSVLDGEPQRESIRESQSAEAFDFGALSFGDDDQVAGEPRPDERQPLKYGHRKSRRRTSRKRGRRRAIGAAIGATALVIFVVLILNLVG